MSTPTVYVLCDTNCKYEGMTKEQIVAAIAEATGVTPTNVDDGFITKIKEMNASGTVKLWIGTMAEFNALTTKDANTLYLMTDDDTAETWDEIADDVTECAETLDKIMNGTTAVPKATDAEKAEKTDFTNQTTWRSQASGNEAQAFMVGGKEYDAYCELTVSGATVCFTISPFYVKDTTAKQLIASFGHNTNCLEFYVLPTTIDGSTFYYATVNNITGGEMYEGNIYIRQLR